MNRRPILRATAAVACAAILVPNFAFAAPPVLDDAELADSRGGLLVADGLALQFGAVVKTLENGVLALQTDVTWTPEGVSQAQQAGAGATPVAPPAGLGAGGPAYYSQDGATFAHDVASGRIVSVLMNTDSDRNFSQQTDVTIQLPGFDVVQGGMESSLMGLRLADDVSLGAISALR